MTQKYDIDVQTVLRYLTRARKISRNNAERPIKKFKDNSIGFYESVLAKPQAKILEKSRAQERLDTLMDLEAPRKFAETESRGQDVVVVEDVNWFDVEHVERVGGQRSQQERQCVACLSKKCHFLRPSHNREGQADLQAA